MEVEDNMNCIHGVRLHSSKSKADDVLKLCFLLMFPEVDFLS